MPEIAGLRIRFEKRDLCNFVMKELGKEDMTEFMNWRSEPRGPQNSFPADTAVVIILRPFLQFGEDIAESKKYPQRSEELDSNGFEESEEESEDHGVGEYGSVIARRPTAIGRRGNLSLVGDWIASPAAAGSQ